MDERGNFLRRWHGGQTGLHPANPAPPPPMPPAPMPPAPVGPAERQPWLVRVIARVPGSPAPGSVSQRATHSLLIYAGDSREAEQTAADVLDTFDVYTVDATRAPNLAIVGPLMATDAGEIIPEDLEQ